MLETTQKLSCNEDLSSLYQQYSDFKAKKLQLDITRGKPSAQQLSLSDPLIYNLTVKEVIEHQDYRNYSSPQLLAGLPEMKNLFAETLNISAENIIIGGNSSLNLMYDTITKAMILPLPSQTKNWSSQGTIKFLCPTPGYDRHFSICENLGIEMINVPLTGQGPDMDVVENLVLDDPMIKGIWCVPQYANPTGEIYSDETVNRLANMKTAADDFIILWDNAYAVHHLDMADAQYVKDILQACQQAGNPNRAFVYASTSKVTYAGAGVSILAANEENLNWYKKQLRVQTIGFDKINQLRHLKLLPNKSAFLAHMKKHADILKPKFDIVDTVLQQELGNDGKYATWTKPKGGYFISFNTKPNLAKKVIEMAQNAGVKLTKAGATFPYGKDPDDRNIRIAPSMPSIQDVEIATKILAIATKIATLEQH
ncbi:aminotransferase class I/II-fold pyridoxal phosphate-dependent enzyme [Facilibium subflavum]|uniref:aminotransferase class I/II-fold pyridoxal phosphate-dependent enzyme n=1 Tax=Facilibium subflavum TaxID=2219058 RepID=UPI000E65C885|nr:aminotransferase class I/II-fold pyridoxal phosphate-dependent enzyme [Facilibium subflavum]